MGTWLPAALDGPWPARLGRMTWTVGCARWNALRLGHREEIVTAVIMYCKQGTGTRGAGLGSGRVPTKKRKEGIRKLLERLQATLILTSHEGLFPWEPHQITGRGSAWLERCVRDAEVASSNLVAPTRLTTIRIRLGTEFWHGIVWQRALAGLHLGEGGSKSPSAHLGFFHFHVAGGFFHGT